MPVNSFDDYPMSFRPAKDELTKPYYLSIAEKLEQEILSGTLAEHTKLPPQRELADWLDLNLSTVTRAYQLCELKGLLYAVTGSGTFVAPGKNAGDTFRNDAPAHTIELGMIRPFYETNELIRETACRILARPESSALFEYGQPLGTNRQLAAGVKWLSSLGIRVSPEQLCITAGAQNALAVALITLFKAGDKIAVDTYTYTNFRLLANQLHIRLIAIDSDRDGIVPDSLAFHAANDGLQGVYLMPALSNPTATFMPETRRHLLADIIRQYGLIVIEDDIYSFLAPQDVTPFFHLMPEQCVHICSISKSLCAGLRVAFLAFPLQYRDALTAGLLNINLKTVSLNAEIVAELILSGKAQEIASHKIQLAATRNRVFEQFFTPQNYVIERFFHWVELPSDLTSEEAEVTALQRGVHLLGSHRFAMHKKGASSFVRLSVVSPESEQDLALALQILKQLWSEKKIEFFV